MQRSKPLRRSRRISPKRATPRRSERVRNPQMRAWLDEAILTTQLRLSLKTEVMP